MRTLASAVLSVRGTYLRVQSSRIPGRNRPTRQMQIVDTQMEVLQRVAARGGLDVKKTAKNSSKCPERARMWKTKRSALQSWKSQKLQLHIALLDRSHYCFVRSVSYNRETGAMFGTMP